MMGVPLDHVSGDETLSLIESIIAARRPRYAATANVDFLVQASKDAELRRILADADLVLCDGMPLVWASKILGNLLPERVAGSDLVPRLLARAEQRGWKIFFLGGTPQSLAQAIANVHRSFPRLNLAGSHSPPFRALGEMDHEDIARRIRATEPDILLVAFGCPKQEKWISLNYRQLGVPFSLGVGATIDFLGGTMRRAPLWMQKSGLEWAFRLAQEPRRLFRRYATDLRVFSREIVRQWWQLRDNEIKRDASPKIEPPRVVSDQICMIRFGARLDAAAVAENESVWLQADTEGRDIAADVSRVTFIDSTGVGLLLRLRKLIHSRGQTLVLIAPSPQVIKVLELMRLRDLFHYADALQSNCTSLRDPSALFAQGRGIELGMAARPKSPVAIEPTSKSN